VQISRIETGSNELLHVADLIEIVLNRKSLEKRQPSPDLTQKRERTK